MCMIEGGERCDVWEEKIGVARKPQRCSECGREIAKGERYKRIGMLYEGSWDTSRECEHCMVPARWLWWECSGYMASAIFEDIDEHVGEYHDFVGSSRLRRVRDGMRAKWRTKSGRLMKVPPLPDFSEPTTLGKMQSAGFAALARARAQKAQASTTALA